MTKKRTPQKAGGSTTPPKAPKRPRATVPGISPATYNTMWEAYCSKQTIRHVAKVAGVEQETARRYILGPAAPAAGMEPLRDRWLRVQAAAQEEQELTVLTLRRGEMDWARKQLTALHGEMELALADVRRRVQAYQSAGGADAPKRELGLAELVGAYERAVRLAEHLLGGPDLTVAGRSGFDPLDSLTEEEALAYATTGVLPESLRTAVTMEIPRRARK